MELSSESSVETAITFSLFPLDSNRLSDIPFVLVFSKFLFDLISKSDCTILSASLMPDADKSLLFVMPCTSVPASDAETKLMLQSNISTVKTTKIQILLLNFIE